jgi:hypothetical protein
MCEHMISDPSACVCTKLKFFRQRAGQIPPTGVVNLLFVLANHAAVRETYLFPCPCRTSDIALF